ncbi:MAG TPA: hypothetical protein ENL03_00655, partial [Phycisphaerae bacterium]|nr:hypothetical protein [Phycisphaerae bacterium]
MSFTKICVGFMSVIMMVCTSLVADPTPTKNWPSHRGSSARLGSSGGKLTTPLHLSWSRQETHPPAPSFRETHVKEGQIANITHDYSNAAIIADGKVFFGSSSEDCVRALDLKTGKLLWTFYTGGAVRLEPTWDQGKLLFGSDDGFVYCLDAGSGRELWHYTPAQRRWSINNGRMMSQWPIRTGVTVQDGIAYFAAGLFPPNGMYLCALNTINGSVVWKNDLDVHKSTAFQGHIMIDGDTIHVPTGRTSPVAFHKSDGSLVIDKPFGYRRPGGGVEILALSKEVLTFGPNHAGVFLIRVLPDTSSDKVPALLDSKGKPRPWGKMTMIYAQIIAKDDETVYILRTYRAKNTRGIPPTVLALDRKSFLKTLHKTMEEEITNYLPKPDWMSSYEDKRMADKLPKLCRWQQKASDQSLSMIAIGGSLVIGGKDFIEMRSPKTGEVIWTSKVQGEVWSLAFADNSLIACTDKGFTYCFRSGEKTGPVEHRPIISAAYKKDEKIQTAAKNALALTDRRKGFCLVLDSGDGQLAYEIARQSEFLVIGLESDIEKVNVARNRLFQSGMYGKRVIISYCPKEKLATFPAYFANLIVSGAGVSGAPPSYDAKDVYRRLRPYGGVLVLGDSKKLANWAGKHIPDFDSQKPVVRGVLPGAGNWSHMYANAANTASSDDKLVKGLEFDLQWMGPPGTERIINRHMTPMGPLYMDGRM